MSKISYATYIKDRLTGFDGDTPREPGQDLVEFPRLLQKLADAGATAKYRRPRCVGEIRVKDLEPLEHDIANLTAAASAMPVGEAFMNAASPGVIALFQPNDYYQTQDAYLEAVAEAMRAEYERIVGAGLLLQIDAPDLAMGRHTMYRDRSTERFPQSRRPAHRGAESRAAQRAGGPRAHARVLGQLRRAASPRRAARGPAARGREGARAGAAVRGRQSAPCARVDRVRSRAPPRRQGADARSDRAPPPTMSSIRCWSRNGSRALPISSGASA